MRFPTFLACLAVLAFALGLSGCKKADESPPKEKPADGSGTQGDHDHENGDHDHENGDHDHENGDHENGDHENGDHDHENGDHDHAAHGDADDAEIAEALAELPEADRIAATAQKICPVSDEPLGGMGAPTKVTFDGQDVFFCCKMCEKKFAADPDKYLAKLKN